MSTVRPKGVASDSAIAEAIQLASMPPATQRYLQVNKAICSVIFNGKFSYAPLYLDIEGDLKESIAASLGTTSSDVEDEIFKAVSDTLKLNAKYPFGLHENLHRSWQNSGRKDAPPFTALLCALSLVAENMHSDEEYNSHNYYDRFFEFLEISDEKLRTEIKKAFKITRTFWEELNTWLKANDGGYGYPTARQINDKWTYVGYPISQALVRDADRKSLSKMFEDYDLSPGERIPSEEMRVYLEKWVNSSYSPPMLKKFWKLPEAPERISVTACNELYNWAGKKSSNSDDSKKRTLTLAGTYTGWPVRSLSIFITINDESLENGAKLSLIEARTDRHGQLAFQNCIDGIFTGQSFMPGAFILGPPGKISLDNFLMGSVAIGKLGAVYLRNPKPIIPLAKDESGPFYIEKSKICMLQKHIVLCHHVWKKKVLDHLSAYARPGFKVIEADENSSLPVGWIVIEDVQIVGCPPIVDDNLEVLCPAAESSIVVDQGFRLFDNFWHYSEQIEVIAVTTAENCELQLWQTDNTQVISQQKFKDGAATISIKSGSLKKNSDFEIRLSQEDKMLLRQSLYLRNADRPLRFLGDRVQKIAYDIGADNPLAVLTASPSNNDFGINQATNPLEADQFSSSSALVALFSEDEDFQSKLNYDLTPAATTTVNCIDRGSHYWIVEPHRQYDSKSDNKWMICRDCHAKSYSRTYKLQRPKDKSANTEKKIISVPHVIPENNISAATIFDAICFLGGGRWEQLLNLSRRHANDAYSGHELIRSLISLGHINVSLKQPNHWPSRWYLNRPHVFRVSETAICLGGYRCESLIKKIADAVTGINARMSFKEIGNAPQRITIECNNINSLENLLASIRDPHERAIENLKNFSECLTSHLPSFSEVERALEEHHLEPDITLEKFELSDGKWYRKSKIDASGAYRISKWGNIYFFVDSQRRMKISNYDVVKLLDARTQRVFLHAYDAQARCFKAALGCPPPTLYERALVMCSGNLPVKIGQSIMYSNVDPAIGTTILRRLYS